MKAGKGLLSLFRCLTHHTYFFCDCYGVLRPGPSSGPSSYSSLARTMLRQESEISSQGFNKSPNRHSTPSCLERLSKGELASGTRTKGAEDLEEGETLCQAQPCLGPILAFLMLPSEAFSGRKQRLGTCEVAARPVLWLWEASHFLLTSLLTPDPSPASPAKCW